jgi:hypothetical protein
MIDREMKDEGGKKWRKEIVDAGSEKIRRKEKE